MAIGPHDQHAEALGLDQPAQFLVRLAGQDARVGLDPAGRQHRGGIRQALAGFGCLGADGHEGDGQPREKAAARDVIHRLLRRGAAVEGDQHAVDGPEATGRHEDRTMRRAHDPFEVRAEVPAREIRRLAALADDDDAGVSLDLADGLDDVALPQARGDRGHAVAVHDGAGVLEDGAAALAGQPGALRVDLGQLLQQFAARAEADRAGQVRLFRGLAAAEHVDQLDRGGGAPCDPGSVVADAFGIDRAVNKGDDLLLCHGSGPSQ